MASVYFEVLSVQSKKQENLISITFVVQILGKRMALVKKIKISNFKSVQHLELELGRVNVFIGENGCGKTSILEGIAMAGAAIQNKLDNEFLASRGIRMTEPSLMRSAFSDDAPNAIGLLIDEENLKGVDLSLSPEKDVDFSWHAGVTLEGTNTLASMLNIDSSLEREALVKQIVEEGFRGNDSNLENGEEFAKRIEKRIADTIEKLLEEKYSDRKGDLISDYYSKHTVRNFLLYAPENYFLRRFEEEGQIRPLGIRGEGLFNHLVELSKAAPETFAAIASEMRLIDWYEGFSIPNDLHFSERRITISDRFISDTIKSFDQRSANEGFLYLLFYFALFMSKNTPKFFAIDNIDNALNPRLCVKLMERLCQLAAKHEKQVIVTTHNPSVLDGLNLEDDEQRLFVIYRNRDGETKARRVMPLKTHENNEPMRLSEAFMRGYLGGLPANF
jgi:predicted ATPase